MTIGKRVLCVGLLLSNLAYAEVESEVSGQLRLRNEHRHFSHDSKDKRNVTGYRVRLGLTTKVNDKLKVYLAPQAAKGYGEIISQSNDESDSSVRSSGDKYHSSVDLFEGYVESHEEGYKYKLGKQKLRYDDQRILGERNWTPGGASFDAFLFQKEIGSGTLDLVHSKISDDNTSNDETDDTLLTFAYYKLKMGSAHQLSLYAIHNNKRKVLESTTYGFRLHHVWGDFTFTTENMFQQQVDIENDEDRNEHNVDVVLKYNLSESVTLGLNYMQASTNYDQLYVNRHLYNGIIDILGRKNLETVGMGLYVKTDSPWKYSIELMSFSRKDKNVAASNQATISEVTGDLDEKHIGDELDILIDYKKNANEKFRLGLSRFQHGKYFTGDLKSSDFAYLEYLVKF